ncbi:MAG: Bug family tripartite tricarboxylate transporter substrate binding protein [Burkholderiales bacterium]
MNAIIAGGLIALAITLPGITPAHAQYPTRAIRFIVPFAAGSANDSVARMVGPALSDGLGRPVVIDNRPGASGIIGAEVAAKSPPDGYTLLMGNISHAINVTLYEKLGYDLVKDFAPVSLLAAGSFMLVVHPSVPAKSVKELTALAKARPGELNIATSGAGIFLAGKLFESMAGIRMTFVTYKSSPQVMIALVGGEGSAAFPGTTTALPHFKSGKLRGLAVTSAQRSPVAPDVPTMAETGLRGYEAVPWYGVLVPAGTPTDIVTRLHAESVKALGRPDVKERFGATDLVPAGTGPDQFGAYVRSEIAKWGKLVKASNLRPE